MKLIPLIFFFIPYPESELPTLRQQYINAAVSEESAVKFHRSFNGIDDQGNATLMAYKAASIVLLAKYEGNIFSKTRLFNKGKKLLEETIEKQPGNYEARLIRLNIQDNVPWITGYTSNIKEDKAFLIKNYSRQDDALKACTKKYVLQSDAFSAEEKKMFN